MNELRCANTGHVNQKAQCQGCAQLCELINSWLQCTCSCSNLGAGLVSAFCCTINQCFRATSLSTFQPHTFSLPRSLCLALFLFVFSLHENLFFFSCLLSCLSSSLPFISSPLPLCFITLVLSHGAASDPFKSFRSCFSWSLINNS